MWGDGGRRRAGRKWLLWTGGWVARARWSQCGESCGDGRAVLRWRGGSRERVRDGFMWPCDVLSSRMILAGVGELMATYELMKRLPM